MVEKIQWDSRISFLFAMIGVAVGVGNIWRFSYVLYINGGGSFFIPYIAAVFLLAIPFLILEYGLGFSFRTSFTEIMKKINPKFEIIAWILVLFTFIVTIYYMVVLSWDLVYLFSSLKFSWGTETASYFLNNVGGSYDFNNAKTFILPTTIGVLITWFILWFISNRDIDKGIGMASKILIPLLFILMAIIIAYAFTLPGAFLGINTLINPNWNSLLNVNIWLAAFGQIIFSLSVGEALALTYASYLPENSKLIDNAVFVVFINSAFEICTAFGVFAILGYMSFTNGIPITDLITEGTGLIFIVFPRIFNVMGFWGHILAPLLFLAILFAGITSALGLFEPMVSCTYNKFGWSRRKTTTILSIIGCIFSLSLTTGISAYIVGVIDVFVNNFGVLLLIPIQSIIFAWIYGLDNVIPVLNEHSTFKVGRLWKIIVKYVSPLILFALWLVGLFDLFIGATNFEIFIYVSIMASILILAFCLSRRKSARDDLV